MATLSSIITPSNITTATNTQTLTNKTLTGAAMNGTLGATTPSTVAATTLSASGAITPSQTAGIVGTTTNNNADAGAVGEYLVSTIAAASGVALTSGTQFNITSLTLTAGDWDVGGTWQLAFGSGTTTGYARASIGTSSASISASSNSAVNTGVSLSDPAGVGTGGVGFGAAMPTTRFSVASSTTIYLVTQCNFSVSTLKAFGQLWARRMR